MFIREKWISTVVCKIPEIENSRLKVRTGMCVCVCVCVFARAVCTFRSTCMCVWVFVYACAYKSHVCMPVLYGWVAWGVSNIDMTLYFFLGENSNYKLTSLLQLSKTNFVSIVKMQ